MGGGGASPSRARTPSLTFSSKRRPARSSRPIIRSWCWAAGSRATRPWRRAWPSGCGAWRGGGMVLELERRRLNKEYAADIVVAAVIGGIVGAKLWYVALHGGPVLSRGG